MKKNYFSATATAAQFPDTAIIIIIHVSYSDHCMCGSKTVSENFFANTY